MHDEATTHYMGMIDQTTLGHSFLKKELGVIPKVGWQIDPFGHSATQGTLMTSGFGFDALYFGRIHYVDLENRQKEAQCEGIWSSKTSPSSSPSASSSVFWGLTGSNRGNYGAPDNFCFDSLCADEPLVGLSEDDLRTRTRGFLNSVGIQASQTKGRNILLTMGSDFQYAQARKNYQNLDLLIDAVGQFLRDGTLNASDFFGDRFDSVRIFYSTPERYTSCKHADLMNSKQRPNTVKRDTSGYEVEESDAKFNPQNWAVKTGDFFPYADCDHCYWTGYFSSRQSLKRLERVGSSFLHAATQIDSMMKLYFSWYKNEPIPRVKERVKIKSTLGKPTRVPSWNSSPFYSLEDAMGVAQHHDAVAGTAKQHVAYDYAKLISSGISDANAFVTANLRRILLSASVSGGALDDLSYCPLLNETVCEVSKQAFENDDNEAIYVFVYNALAHMRSEAISLPVYEDVTYEAYQYNSHVDSWSHVQATLVPNMNYAQVAEAARFSLYLDALEMPPLGFVIFRITKSTTNFHSLSVKNSAVTPSLYHTSREATSSHASNTVTSEPRDEANNLRPRTLVIQSPDDIIINNDIISVKFDRSTGVIQSIQNIDEGGVILEIEQRYGFYTAFSNENSREPEKEDSFNVKGDGMCLPGYINAEGDEMPWLLGSANKWQNAGAYIFRPTTPKESLHTLSPKVPGSVLVFQSNLVTEVHAEFGELGQAPWIKQISRIFHGKNYVEVEYAVGPVPIDDCVGKEVIARYSSSIKNGGKFFSDSNGRQFVGRTLGNHSVFGKDVSLDIEPVASNFYPVNTAMFIEDDEHSFSVLVDRSQAGSSLSEGSLELIIQRRLLHDDSRGVGEPLNETDIGITPCPPFGDATRLGSGVIVKGIHLLKVGKARSGARIAREHMDQVFSRPHMFVASSSKQDQIRLRQLAEIGLKSPLPQNVMIISFVGLEEDDSFLVRLGHQFDDDESVDFSFPVEIDLQDLFPNKSIHSISEKTLSGNQDLSSWEQRRLSWDKTFRERRRKGVVNKASSVVVLEPLEIRTFEIIVK